MALIFSKPTSPSRRFLIKLNREQLTKKSKIKQKIIEAETLEKERAATKAQQQREEKEKAEQTAQAKRETEVNPNAVVGDKSTKKQQQQD